MDNVPTQSYAPEGNELIPGDNTSYFNGLRRAARVYVSLSIMGLTEDRITERFLSYVRVIGCSSIPSEAWPVFRAVSTSRESQLRVSSGILSALSADQVSILTFLVFPLT